MRIRRPETLAIISFAQPTFWPALPTAIDNDKSLVATAAKAGLLQMQFIFGKDFSEKDYEMAGGTNYEKKKN